MKYGKLYGKMLERGIKSIREFAKLTGIHFNTAYRKFEGKAGWSRDDIVKVCELLEINDPKEIVDIFLPEISR